MSDYETSYDPKYGYNRNAFAHKTLPMKIVGKTVKLIAMPIDLPAKPSTITKTSSDQQAAEKISPTSPSSANGDAAYVNIPAEQADELNVSGQAVPADGKEATHELVPEKDENGGIERE
jgi:hypothetical protein